MTTTLHVGVNGYSFTFIVSNAESECGVIVNPDVDTDDQGFIEALSFALSAYPEYRNINEVHEMLLSGQAKDLTNWSAHSLHELFNQIDRALSQRPFPLAETDTSRFRELRERLQYEIDRRITNAQSKAAELARRRISSKRAGYVYLIESSHGVYKIGLSRNPEARMATFGVKLPFEVEYCCLIQTDDMRGLEVQLHDRYASKRVNGEWFALSTDDVAYIKSLAVQS